MTTHSLADELSWRGFINQTTFADITLINEARTFYWGVDPSADSMHIGNLAPAMMIRHMMNHGHNAILLVGGATGFIGDPDGKKQERDLKTVDEIAKNKAAIAAQYESVFAGQSFEVVDNYDWFKDFNYLDFLRKVGKNVSMTQMLDREFIKARIGEGGQGISYAEFSYSLIQGYDFVHLFREKNATLQVAGADQWGNSIAGVELIRRLEQSEAHVVTAPLIINKSTGRKFGKTEEGAVWLDPDKTSPYKFYQFWLNVDDETAQDLIKVYTMLPLDEIESIIVKHHEAPHERLLQKTLASEVTALVHGSVKAAQVQRVTGALFSGDMSEVLSDDTVSLLEDELTTVEYGNIIAVLVNANVAKSNGEARRLVESGAITVNGQKVSSDFDITERSLVKKGKNTFILVR